MYLQCVLILALSLVQNEAAGRFSFSQGSVPGKAFRSGSPKLIQGSFDTAAELAKLIQKVKKEIGGEKDRKIGGERGIRKKLIIAIEDTSTPEDDNHLQALFNVIQKKIENEGIRIHVLKNSDVLDKYKKDLDSRAVFIDNPDVLDKYVNELKNQKTDNTQQYANIENLLLKRRNAVFRLEESELKKSKDFVKPLNLQDSKNIRKRYEGGKSEEFSKRFNKVTNKDSDVGWEMSSGKKQRDMLDRSREVRKEAKEKPRYKNERENRGFKKERENRGFKKERENRGFKKERENRGFKKERENHGFKSEQENRGFKDVRERSPNKREFKDYHDFKSQGNPNLARPKPSKVVDYDYDKPRKPKKAIPRDYDDGFESKKMNKDKFDDYGGDKKKGGGWGQSIGSELRKKPAPKMNWDDKPNRNFDNNERRRPKKDDGWAPSIRGGSSDYNARSSKNNDGYGFGNTPIPFNRPRNIYVNENGE